MPRKHHRRDDDGGAVEREQGLQGPEGGEGVHQLRDWPPLGDLEGPALAVLKLREEESGRRKRRCGDRSANEEMRNGVIAS